MVEVGVVSGQSLGPVRRRKLCSRCGRPGHDRRSCGRLEKGPRVADPWADLEWEEHAEARRIVADHPDGMTLEEVGEAIGVTRERVRQIEAEALEKLLHATGFATVDVEDVTVTVLPCDRCGCYYARKGRVRVCPDCENPQALPRRPALLGSGPSPSGDDT